MENRIYIYIYIYIYIRSPISGSGAHNSKMELHTCTVAIEKKTPGIISLWNYRIGRKRREAKRLFSL